LAYHIRRRLTADEEQLVGPAVDCRGTEEWQRRLDATLKDLPVNARLQVARLAAQEREIPGVIA
jgi:hypothetical protein